MFTADMRAEEANFLQTESSLTAQLNLHVAKAKCWVRVIPGNNAIIATSTKNVHSAFSSQLQMCLTKQKFDMDCGPKKTPVCVMQHFTDHSIIEKLWKTSVMNKIDTIKSRNT